MAKTQMMDSFKYNIPYPLALTPAKTLLVLIASIPFLYLFKLILRRSYERATFDRRAKAYGAKPPQNLASLKDPVLGLDYTLATVKAGRDARYLSFIWGRFLRLGSTYVTRRFLYDTVHTIDPENLKSMLATDSGSFCMAETRKAAMRPLFGHGIFIADGPHWAHSRALIRPSFTRTNMQPLLSMLERHFQAMVECIPTDGSTVDLQEIFSNFTMDASTEFLMGHSTHTLDPASCSDRETGFVADYLECCLEAVRKVQMGPIQFLFPFGSKKTRAARDRAWAYIDEFVSEALDLRRMGKLDAEIDDAAEYNFLREVARNTDDPVMLRTQILNILLASRDTTAGLLGNFFHLVSRDRRVFQKLKDEVAERLQGELPTDVQIKDMVYLRWCINESKQTCHFFKFLSTLFSLEGRICISVPRLPLIGFLESILDPG